MDITKINELMSERRNVVAQQREMNDKLYKDGKPNRDFTAEEQAKFDAMNADVTRLTAAIQREKSIGESEDLFAQRQDDAIRAALENPSSAEGLRATSAYKSAFRAMLENRGVVPSEFRATLQKAVSTQGGYLVPIEYETKIVKKLYDANIMRQLGTVTRTTSQVDIPIEGNLPTFSWISELGTYGTTDLTVGQVVLGAYKLGGVVTISEELIADAFLDIGDYVADRSGLSAGFSEEAAYVVGDGNGKPTGVLTTIAASGVTQTSAVSGKVSTDDLLTLFYGLPRPFRKNASYVVADSVIASISSQKASTAGTYLWQPSLTLGAPDLYHGKPIYTSDFLAAVAAGSVSALFGDFSYYQIVDRVGWSMQLLDQLFALNGQIGYKMWERTDAKLLLPQSIQSLTTHA